MIVSKIEITQMPMVQHFVQTDTLGIRSRIGKKIGRAKTENYLDLLARFLSNELSKLDFDKLCFVMIGRENICLHNALLRGIIKNVCLSRTPPAKTNILERSLGQMKELNGLPSSTSFHSLCKDLPHSPCNGRTLGISERRFKDNKGNSHVALGSKRTSPTEVVFSGNRPPCSIEDGEEIDQLTVSFWTHFRSHAIEAPFGVSPRTVKLGKKWTFSNMAVFGPVSDTCYSSGELPVP